MAGVGFTAHVARETERRNQKPETTMNAEIKADWSEYTLPLSGDPSCYGDQCTPERAEEITDKIESLVKQQFPGIRVDHKPLIGTFRPKGPDESRCDEIHQWVQDNWMAAL